VPFFPQFRDKNQLARKTAEVKKKIFSIIMVDDFSLPELLERLQLEICHFPLGTYCTYIETPNGRAFLFDPSTV
jgi:hypothetical protein